MNPELLTNDIVIWWNDKTVTFFGDGENLLKKSELPWLRVEFSENVEVNMHALIMKLYSVHIIPIESNYPWSKRFRVTSKS